MTTTSDRLWVKCGPCGHVWAALHLPMEAQRACKAMSRLYCPACGELKKIYMAQEADLPAEAKTP